MLLNLAPLSRGGGYPMTRLDTWQRYQARYSTAPLWKNVCNGISVAKGWLWCCLLPSCIGFGYHTHCTMVIAHIAKSKNQPNLVKLPETDQIEHLHGQGAKKCYIDGNYWKEGGLLNYLFIFILSVFSLPNHWAAQASVFVFPMFPHHPLSSVLSPHYASTFELPLPLLHHHHSTQADATKSLKEVSTGWAGGAQTLGTFSCLHSNSMWLGITLLTRWSVLVGWVHKEARFAINIIESIIM